MKTHRIKSAPTGITGERELWTPCGLGVGGREMYEFDAAKEGTPPSCKACLKAEPTPPTEEPK